MGLAIDASLSTQLPERRFVGSEHGEVRRDACAQCCEMIVGYRKFASLRRELREVLYRFDVFQE